MLISDIHGDGNSYKLMIYINIHSYLTFVLTTFQTKPGREPSSIATVSLDWSWALRCK